MGTREHEDGVEVVQELHVVSSELGRTLPLCGSLANAPLHLLPPRTAAPVRGRGSRQEVRPPVVLERLVGLTSMGVQAVSRAHPPT